MKKPGFLFSRLAVLLLALCVAAALSGCSLFGGDDEPDEPEEVIVIDPEYPVEIGGAKLAARPARVVSLAPSLTEKLYDLGMEDRLVGVSDYCIWPEDARELPRCGNALLPDLAEIAELEPQLVVTATDLSEEALIQLQQMDVEVAVLPGAKTLDGWYESYRNLSLLLDGNVTGGAAGEAFVDGVRARADRLQAAVRSAAGGEDGPQTALYLRYLDFVVATGDTLEHELLDLIGLTNIGESYTEWIYPAERAGSEEGLAEFSAVDVIFCDETDVSIADLEGSEFYSALPAVRQDDYFYINALAVERQGLSMLSEFEAMAAHCYPDAGVQVGARAVYPQEEPGGSADGEEPAGADGGEEDADPGEEAE